MIHKIARQKKFGNIIKNIPLFTELSDEEIERIERCIIKMNFTKDRIVLFEGKMYECQEFIKKSKNITLAVE